MKLELNVEISALLYQFIGRTGTQIFVREEILCVCNAVASHYRTSVLSSGSQVGPGLSARWEALLLFLVLGVLGAS